MLARHRRQFLAEVGQGMLVAGVGSAVAIDLGLVSARAAEAPTALTFGELEPLVVFMQETPLEKLIPATVEKINAGTELRTLIAAAALANARSFGGQDYIGFHSFMALAPALAMSGELSASHSALPVLKVLYRNTGRIQAYGGRSKEELHPVEPLELSADAGGEVLQQATRSANRETADRTFAALSRGPAGEAFNHLQYSVQDEVDVHRVVLAWRAWDTLSITGPEFAQSMLRQSVLYCVKSEQHKRSRGNPPSAIRELLPKLLDEYKLLSYPLGEIRAEDSWVAKMSQLIANAAPAEAADAVAAALAEHISPLDIGEAISLAANELVLRDPGRVQQGTSKEKPPGSVHGDSPGVHASDSANAWRNIAAASNPRNAVASLVVGAYHTAGQYGRMNKEMQPLPEELEKVKATDAAALVSELDGAVKENNQARAAALVARYGEQGHDPRAVFDTLLRYAASEDGALHAEKYYRTVSEEFARTRPAFRWRQLIALARVTASQHGHPAPGYQQARDVLKV